MDVVHYIEKYQRFLYTGCYSISFSIPKYLFVNDYPHRPRNLGDKIRKARMDAGLKIKELAHIIGVTEDTIINWEKRNIRPTPSNLNLICVFLKHPTPHYDFIRHLIPKTSGTPLRFYPALFARKK